MMEVICRNHVTLGIYKDPWGGIDQIYTRFRVNDQCNSATAESKAARMMFV